MKRSEAARYARWSAVLALLLAVITVGVYVQHGLVARIQKRKAPPAPANNVERESKGLTFSKVEGDRKVFTVDASKSTEYRDQDASLLEEVKITIFGPHSERHDTIRTRSCQYSKAHGSIVCSGTVQIDLQSAAAAEPAAHQSDGGTPQPTAHVETHNVKFDQASGVARTDERVTFTFPEGTGVATGVEYNSQLGTLQLLRDVKMSLRQTGGPKGAPGQEVHVTGSSLDFNRDTRLLRLFGPAHAETPTAQLDAGEITMNLDEDYRAQKLLATAGAQGKKPHAASLAATGAMTLSANVITAWFDPSGWLKKLDATGSVDGSRKSSVEEDEFTAANSSVLLWPEISQPKQINMDGHVVMKTSAKNGQACLLETGKLRMDFTEAKGDRSSQPKRAETLAAGTIQWMDAQGDGKSDGKAGAARTRLQADKFILNFAAGAASQLSATGNVQAERALPGGRPQISTAKRGEVQLAAGSGWTQIELDGDVRLKDGDRSGQADHAITVRAAQSMTLTGHAFVRDASTETRAEKINFQQATGDVSADGGVRTSTFPGKNATPQFSGAPATIAAEKMQGNSKTGRALYSGHARLWQGDSVLEADTIELLQKTRQLNASGNVRAVFPQAAQREPGTVPVSSKPPKKTNLWHLAAKSLAYEDLEDRAHLEGNVVVQSEAQRMRSGLLDLYFTRAKPTAAPQKPSKATGGAQQISRAVGTGGVIVEEQSRKATAERAEYTAADGKFVMSGGNPTLFDGTQGTTTGR
ncbi:MAG: LPS export ABC transporter periplasmic protein LptC, partial [Acidobacteriota bacterium]|nr:LPS export ABC transporter periplasmic protein LptC [Acidobacteriota bacterium]